MTKNRTRIFSAFLAILVVICLLPISRLSAADNTDFSFNKNEKPAETYSIDKDSTYVVVKQATSAFLFLRNELTEEQQKDLMERLKEEDGSLKNSVDSWSIEIADKDTGIAIYNPPDGTGLKIGSYEVNFNTGKVTIMNQKGELDKSKISHLDYGKYGPTTEPEPIPDPETGTIIIVKTVKGIDEADLATLHHNFRFTLTGSEDTSEIMTTVESTGTGSSTTQLPAGTYTVEEDSSRAQIDGYTLTETTYKVGEEGDATAPIVEVKADDTVTVYITNTYTKDSTPLPEPETGSISITKNIVGASLSADKTFTFQVTNKAGVSQIISVFVPEGSTTGYNNTTNYFEPGTYTIEEVLDSADIDGYTLIGYTPKQTVTVNAGETTYVTVTNTYEPTTSDPDPDPEEKPGKIQIVKSVVGVDENAIIPNFWFLVKGTETSEYLCTVKYDSSTGTYKNVIEIPDIPVGNYTIEECEGDGNGHSGHSIAIDGYTLKETTYKVGEDGEETTAAPTVDVKTGDIVTVYITNTYTKDNTPLPEPETGSISITKNIVGASLSADKTFTFQVTNKAGVSQIISVFIPEGSTTGYNNTTNYFEPGTYTIEEVLDSADIDGYTLIGYTPKQTVTVNAGETTYVTVTNTYEPTTSDPDPDPEDPPVIIPDDDPTLSIVKKWVNDDPSTRPDSITVDIYHDGEYYDSMVISGLRFGDSDTWRDSYDIPARYEDDDWWVVESDVPAYYDSDVEEIRENVFYITNTYEEPVIEEPVSSEPSSEPSEVIPSGPSEEPSSEPTSEPSEPAEPTLPQTGQTWWPIILLCAGGAVLVAFGAFRTIRGNGRRER